MYAQVEKSKENKSRAVANSVGQKKKGSGKQGFGFVDNRPESLTQRKLQDIADKKADNSKISNACQNTAIYPLQLRTIYRGMRADVSNGTQPLLGNNFGFELGVRSTEGSDNVAGYVDPQSGGTSTASPRNGLRNVSFTTSSHYAEGTHKTTDKQNQAFRWIWSFDDSNLPTTLVASHTHKKHYAIEPAVGQQLSRTAFETAVQGTQTNWTRIDN